ncbi:PTS glucose transporter subunit IIA [Haloimpatiens sp. FM7315]|uniref:PTS sugar transporter subunit IIA n=1 Tax=Haloimpatiens sp. FM7315 TaxID=3298609 RepID=UPI0035A36608
MIKGVDLYLPIMGDILSLTNVEDYLFRRKILGEGVVIKPKDNVIFSPVDGEIELVYNTKHAILLKTVEGLKILIHLGLNTTNLEKLKIKSFIKTGDKVKRGDKLLTFDKINLNNGNEITIPVVIINTEIIKALDINYNAFEKESILMKAQLYMGCK